MNPASQLLVALMLFLLDEAGGSLMEFVLLSALVGTVFSLAVLAIA